MLNTQEAAIIPQLPDLGGDRSGRGSSISRGRMKIGRKKLLSGLSLRAGLSSLGDIYVEEYFRKCEWVINRSSEDLSKGVRARLEFS